MVPTLDVGQRVLTNRLINHPSVGDIVVFHPPHGADNQDDPICGNPNQGAGHPQACDTPTATAVEPDVHQARGRRARRPDLDRQRPRVSQRRPGERLLYTEPCGGAPSCTFRKPITIPPGDYFMMGDNRGESDDSRFWGPVPDKWVIGVAFFTYWPPDRIGTL